MPRCFYRAMNFCVVGSSAARSEDSDGVDTVPYAGTFDTIAEPLAYAIDGPETKKLKG